MSVHRERVASLLRRTIQEILERGLADPRIRGLISVAGVRVSEDLADATVMVSVMPASEASLTLHGLRSAAPHIRMAVAKRADMRRTPRLHFRLDTAVRREADVLAAIREAVGEDVEESSATAAESGDARGQSPPGAQRPTWGRPWTEDESHEEHTA